MVNHPFIEFLRTLSKDEVQKFRDFISSPYFNKKERLIKFFDAAIKYYPSFAEESINKENFYQKLYPLKIFHVSTIRDTLSDLLKLSKEFLMIENIKNYKPEVADILLGEYVNRNLRRQFFKSVGEYENELIKCKIDSEFFLLKHNIEANKYNFNALNSKFTKINHVIEQFDELKKSELYFLLYFILEFISDYVKVFSFSMSYNIGQKVNLYDEVIENIDLEKIYHLMKGKIEYDFILELYLKMLQAFKNYTNDIHYRNYKTILEKNSKNLSNNELTFHFSNLINFCVLKRSRLSEKLKYDSELFELYKVILKEGYYGSYNSIHFDKILFRNILLLALRLGEHEWIKYFIVNYSSKLSKKDQANMINYSYVYLYNDLKEFDKSLEHLNEIELNYFTYKYDVYNLKVKIYYELEYFEPALELIHTYTQYIRNDKLLERSLKMGHNNFLKYTEQLILYRLAKESIQLGFLKKKIQKSDIVFHKKWLIEKIVASNEI